MKTDNLKIPEYSKLVEVTFSALKSLGGSGNNNEIIRRNMFYSSSE